MYGTQFDNKKKYVIINADDFGLTKEVSDGIIESFKKGCVTSTSIIPVVNGKLLKYSAKLLKKNSGLDYGVHVTLCSDKIIGNMKPVSNNLMSILKHNLTKDGSKNFYFPYPSLKLLFKYSIRSNLKLIENEIESQILKVLGLGLKPSHINSHYYIGDIPPIFTILVKMAAKYNIHSIRLSKEPFKINYFFSPGILSKMTMLTFFGYLNNPKIKKAKLNTSHYYFGASTSGNMNEINLLRILRDLKPGITEILVHPSNTNSKYFFEKEEKKALVANRILDFIKQNNIILTNFRDLFLK